MASLHKLAQRERADLSARPRRRVRDAPRFVAAYILHRKAREASILHRLAKGASDIPTHRARDLYRARSAPDRRGRHTRCWRIWRTWWRAARSRPTDRRRSAAFIAWPGLSASDRAFFAFFDLLAASSRACRLSTASSIASDSDVDARRIGAEIVPAVARGRADIDARAVRIGANAHHHVVAKAEDRRARDRLDAAVAAAGLRRARIDDAPFALGDDLQRRIRRRSAASRDDQRLDRRIGRPSAIRRRAGPHRRSGWRRASAAARSPRSAADRSDRW